MQKDRLAHTPAGIGGGVPFPLAHIESEHLQTTLSHPARYCAAELTPTDFRRPENELVIRHVTVTRSVRGTGQSPFDRMLPVAFFSLSAVLCAA